MPVEEQNWFVELNRRFRNLEQKAKAEDAAVESYAVSFFFQKDSLNWDDLLKEKRVVILGEPGSGKTWEMQERTRNLNSQGKFAFFVRLDRLVEREMPMLFDAEQQKRFTRWKLSQDIAYFFLDSVDEAKFRKISDFHTTLNRFRNELGSDVLLRTKIFLSSRISEWKPNTDRFEFQRLFPLPPSEKRTGEGQSKEIENPKPELLVVRLEPLDRGQVERFARANGVSDVHAFTMALDQAFAWEFARRPLDVADLIGFWNAKGRMGSLTELIEFDVSSKLRPREGRDEFPLSEAEAREGAEWLTAASLFSRKFSFRIPDDGLTDANSLEPRACLPSHWRDDETRALLNRAIFDSAVYGYFRFHHRRVGEYLAARWLASRMEKGCRQIELDNLLSDVVRGRKVLRPSLRSIAAWLCSGDAHWNRFVRSLVVETDPGVHLLYGDPASLPTDYRREVLLSLSRLCRTRRRMWMESSPDCLARLADPDLSTDIAAMIADRELAVDFRIELLDIVRFGRLAACTDVALSVVASSDEPAVLKSHAASAIGAINDLKLDEQLFQVVCQLPHLPNLVCIRVVQALYPRSMSPTELVQLLAKTETVREFSADLPISLNSHFKSVVTTHNAGDLLKHLIILAKAPPLARHGQKTLPVSEQFCWIGELIPTVLEILLQKSALSEEETASSAESLQLLGHMRECHELDWKDIENLDRSTMRHPGVRRSYLWRVAAEFRREHRKEPTMSVELFGYWEVLRPCPEDFSWLVEDIRGRTVSKDRLLALRLAIDVWDSSGRTFANRWCLRRAVAGDASLRAAFRQSVMTRPLFPLKRFWWQHVRCKYSKWWWIRKWDTINKSLCCLRQQFNLLCHLRLIESGKPLEWLARLSREADEKNNSHWTPSTWSGLEKNRGKWITRAAKRGCMAAWRRFTPQLPHEKPKPNETSIGVMVGLTGLQVEFDENPNAISKLTENEAKLAVRYAMDELNGFPKWFQSLASLHPKEVRDVICECVGAEWQFPPDRQETHEVLAKLAWHTEGLIHLLQEELLSLLCAGDPQNYNILWFAVSILMRQTNPPLSQLAQFAAQRASSGNDPVTIVLWLSVWMHIDGEAAVTRLASILQNSVNPNDIVVRLCSILLGEETERGPFSVNPSYLRPACLRRLIPIVYRHVRITDDLDRIGEAYFLTARDHAQRFRSVLLNRLESDEDSAATDVLQELADDPAMSHVRDWIMNILDKRLLNEANSDPWTPADIREFAEHHEVDPKNDRELFAIARKRLQVLKWDVEESDNSPRDDLRKGDREILLRRWLHRWLIERSQKRYVIPQEEEIDQQQRPDLRLENPKFSGPVSIEVKWADNWTLSELLEGLEIQLVGQYLRAHNSRYGIYLLGFNGKKQNWKDTKTGSLLTFDALVKIISQHAISLMEKNPKIAGLEVVSINFCQPKSI